MQHYWNLDLELFDHQPDPAGERFRVRVASSPAGEQPAGEAVSCRLPRELRARLEALGAPFAPATTPRRADLVTLGRALGDLLLPAGTPRELFERSLGQLDEGEGLRLRLRIEDPELAALPWELAHVPPRGADAGEADSRGFLALRRDLSLVRHEPLPTAQVALEAVATPRVLCVLSNPREAGVAPLDLGAEARSLEAAVTAAGAHLTLTPSATLAALQTGLDTGAQVFHYAGHGTFATEGPGGYLLFEREDGRGDPVSADELGLNLAGAGIRLAVLNGCETARRDGAAASRGVAPRLVRAGIPAVVAHQYETSDAASIEFARRLYEKLVAGTTLDEAVSAARLAVANLPNVEPLAWATAVLYLRLPEGSESVLFPAPAPPPLTTARPGWTRRHLLLAAGLGLAVAGGGAAWVFRRPTSPTLILLPYDGVMPRLPTQAPSRCRLEVHLDGRPLVTVPGVTRQAVILTARLEDAQQRLAGEGLGQHVQELLALRAVGADQRAARERLLTALLERGKVVETRLPKTGTLKLTLLEVGENGVETVLYRGERGIEALDGRIDKFWFLEGVAP